MNYTHKYAMQLNEEIVSHEDTYNIILNTEKIYVLRFDGVKMTKNFLGNPDARTPFFKTMKETLQRFMEHNVNLKFAYSFSDEISILLSKEVLEEYKYRLEKILSIFSSQIGFIFASVAVKNNLNLDGKVRSFDCRIVEFDNMYEVREYFVSRQVFQISSHFLRLKYLHCPKLKATNTDIIKNVLLSKGIDYDKFSRSEKYGFLYIEDCYQHSYEFLEDRDKLMKQLELDSKFVYMKKLEKRRK